jgi:hypothetical protein
MPIRQSLRARRRAAGVLLAGALAGGLGTIASAAPYASGVSFSGTTVNFVLNEPADALAAFVNGVPVVLDGSTAGSKSFTLPSAGTPFSIVATKADAVGYTIPTGGMIAASANGLSQPANLSGTRQISLDSNVLNRFNSPRGVSVVTNAAQPTFGTAYVANSAAGATTGVVRNLGDGIYALRADQSDAFGNGDTAANPGTVFASSSASSPFRLTAAADGNVYVADFSDANGNVYRLSPNLTAVQQMLAGIGGPATLPAGQNHGSTTAVYVEGSAAGGNLAMYTLDEDLKSSQFGGPAGDDRNSLWRYSIGGAALPYTGTPAKVNTVNVLVPLATSDLDRGADGKFYLAQNRAAGNEAGLVVLNSDGSPAFDSLTASRTLLGNPTAADIVRNVLGMAVSPDQKYVALILNNSDVAVIPLVNGIPNLAGLLEVDTGPDVNSGRDIAFDAADNIHYVSSGQALYRVLSPGGVTTTTLSYDGNAFTFVNGPVPEPGSVGIIALASGAALLRRRRRHE